jgi:hypothetical protein
MAAFCFGVIMPYTISKNSKGKFCVYKKGKDGARTGKSLGCHTTRDKAVDQIGAIESNEGKSINYIVPTDVKLDANGVMTTTVSSNSTNDYTYIDWDNVEDVTPYKASMEEVTSGALSFNDLINNVRDAWYEENEYRGWVVEVYTDRVIVSLDKKHWSIPYTFDSDGDVDFAPNNEWTEVERKSEWAAKSFPIKALGDDRIGGPAMLFGNEKEKDLDEEFFTKSTEEVDKIFKAMDKLPWLVEHAHDDHLKSEVIAEVDTLEQRDGGWWWEAKVKQHQLYLDYVEPLIEKGMLFTSTGTLPAAKRVKKSTGEITRWPIVEITGTVSPMEYRMLEVPIEDVKAHYKSIGLEFLKEKTDKEETEEDPKGAEKARVEARVRQSELNLRLSQL